LLPGPRVTYAVSGAALGGDGYISGVAATSAALTFSEGTKVDLAAGSRAWVVSTDARGARVRLEDGRAHFDVVHRPGARWTVEAGPFTVQVTGTTFDVRWSGREDLFEVRLLAGGVTVRGPLIGEGVRLRKGESFLARVNQGLVQIAGAPATAADSPRPPPPPTPAKTPAVDAPPPAAPPAPPPAPARRRSTTKVAWRQGGQTPLNLGAAWRQRVASGDFRSVLDEAEEQGIDRCLRGLPADRLSTLADAARYAGHATLAEKTLLAERARFPASPAAKGAAFLLGRLAEETAGSPEVALRWYETYLAEAPAGSFAGEALGRRMLLIHRRDGAGAAEPLAREYLRRFPGGAYAGQASGIADGAR
ncbi:MAG TPA: FecR family protein, partial [Polyangia bacterium]|nr:FecR family protein [Polyangia bacterium]